MLNHILAGIVGLGGLSLFLSGFFFPEVRRKPDLVWSGVALLYALALWIEGDRTPGGALLGHIFSVSLIVWFGWQTLQQRQQFAAPEERTSIPSSLETLTPFLKAGWGRMTVAYGETVDWVQNRLGSDDTGVAPESLTSQSPQGDALEDVWDENKSAVSNNSPVPAVTTETLESPETELIAPTESKMQVETPQSEKLQPNAAPLKPEALQDPPPAAPDSPVGENNSPISATTGNSATAASEISNGTPSEETVAEAQSAPLEEEQGIPNEDTMHEDIAHNPTPEEDDGSWPPEDSVT
jgi:Ycf66 protein N-terminus